MSRSAGIVHTMPPTTACPVSVKEASHVETSSHGLGKVLPLAVKIGKVFGNICWAIVIATPILSTIVFVPIAYYHAKQAELYKGRGHGTERMYHRARAYAALFLAVPLMGTLAVGVQVYNSLRGKCAKVS